MMSQSIKTHLAKQGNIPVMLIPLTENLWHVPHAFRVNGLPITTRMTVVRLPGRKLWLHSPIPITDGLHAELEALGAVEFIVAPSKNHHLFLAHCAAAFPQARLYGAPGLRAKRPDVGGLQELSSTLPGPWQPELEHMLFGGIPFANETVWLHRPSGTLIITDLLQWWRGPLPWAARSYAALTGVRRQLAVARTVRALVRDRLAARSSAEQILRWPFTRVIVAHNAVVEENAHAEAARALAWF